MPKVRRPMERKMTRVVRLLNINLSPMAQKSEAAGLHARYCLRPRHYSRAWHSRRGRRSQRARFYRRARQTELPVTVLGLTLERLQPLGKVRLLEGLFLAAAEDGDDPLHRVLHHVPLLAGD